jgi:hypothetical protein
MQMVFMHRAVVRLGGHPTQQDVADLVTACLAQQDAAAAPGVLSLLGLLREVDRQGAAMAAGEGLEEQLQALAQPRPGTRVASTGDEYALVGVGADGMALAGQEVEEVDSGWDDEWHDLYEEFGML